MPDFIGALFGWGNVEQGGGNPPVGQAQGQAAALVGQHAVLQQQNAVNYNYVVPNPEWGINIQQPPVRAEQQMPVGFFQVQQRRMDWKEALDQLSRSFVEEGLEFVEIVVPKETMIRLHTRFYDGLRNPVYQEASELRYATHMGMVKFVLESSQPKFDLEKYMETLD